MAVPDYLLTPDATTTTTTGGQQEEEGYVQLVTSGYLAFASSAQDETVEAIKMIISLFELRDFYIPTYPVIEPLTVQPPDRWSSSGYGSNEPNFDPFAVKPLQSCHATYRMVEGVFIVYWDGVLNDDDEDEEEETGDSATDGGGGGGRSPSSSLVVDKQQTDNSSAGVVVSRALPPTSGQQPCLSRTPSVRKFLAALKQVMGAVQHPACKTFSYKRLRYLQERYSLHLMFNGTAEQQETKENHHRDFYNVRKVDTHVHHSACMNQKHLLRFIRKKYRTEPSTIVHIDHGRRCGQHPDGGGITLKEVFEQEVGVSAHQASTDHLDVHALGSCFQRFDLFNLKYNPFGEKLLREMFLKTDNYINGSSSSVVN
eukprot:GHVS01080884.1.p2 GENE.GHVS01080884.1~~GHVS01080884.1.p2  ORF type:complete len:370 (+),score=98.45 GHVS01080884.1:572-1681(+)